MFVANAAASSGLSPVRVDRLDCRALTGRVRLGDKTVLLAKPQTFMNLSGESVKGLLTKYEIPLERLLVVVDDLALPVGRVRLKGSGSSGGQKGLQSVVDCMKTLAVPRLRVGVRGDHFREGEDRADYVLDRFPKSERALYQEGLADAASAIETFVLSGLDAAMNRFNRSPEDPADTSETLGSGKAQATARAV